MPLIWIEIQTSKISDLSPLRGMPLEWLTMNSTPVSDLSPLRGAPLQKFICSGAGTRSGGRELVDFSPLKGAPLKVVEMRFTGAANLDFLADAPIEELDISETKVADLSPLRGKPLKRLFIWNTKVSDLSPLRGAPIEALDIGDQIKDLTQLLDFPKLEKLRVSKLGKLLEPLRNHPSLKFIGYDPQLYRPVAEFWAEYDADQATGKK